MGRLYKKRKPKLLPNTPEAPKAPPFKSPYPPDAYHPEKTEANKKRFYDALEKHLGLVWRATKATKIPSITHYKWMKKDPLYKEQVDFLIELKRDFVEKQLISLVEDKDVSAVTFTAKCLLRKRGYDQSTEIRNAEGEKFELAIGDDVIANAIKEIYKHADD